MGLFDLSPTTQAAPGSVGEYNQALLRQQIALAMLKRGGNRGYPNTVGQGLTAIGDALAERGMMNRAEQAQSVIDQRAEALRNANAVSGDATATPPPATPPAATPAPAATPRATSDASDVLPSNARATSYEPPEAPASPDTSNTALGGATQGPSPADIAQARSINFNPVVRNQISTALMQRQGGPQANPTLGGSEEPLAPTEQTAASATPTVLSDIPKAPDVPLVPGAQLAQAEPTPRGPTRIIGPKATIKIREPETPPGTMPVGPAPIIPPDAPGIKPPEAVTEPLQPAPSLGRIPISPEAQGRPPFNATPPAMPDMNANQKRALRDMSDPDPSVRMVAKQTFDYWEQRRKEAYAPTLQQWENQRDNYNYWLREEQKRNVTQPQTEAELQAAELKRKEALGQALIRQQLGDQDPKEYAANLGKTKGDLMGLQSSNQSIQRVRDLVKNNKMFTGASADTDTFLGSIAPMFGLPVNPKVTGTQQFRQAMANVMATYRKAVVGPGSQSEGELKLLLQASGADPKLQPQTILKMLDYAETLNQEAAIAHQENVRRLAGETDPNRIGVTYSQFGLPFMREMVPQYAVDLLKQTYAGLKTNEERNTALKYFDNTFHTPGLGVQILKGKR